MIIKKIQDTNKTTYDIGAKYDVNDNEITSYYAPKDYTFITTADIDEICGTLIQDASIAATPGNEVKF